VEVSHTIEMCSDIKRLLHFESCLLLNLLSLSVNHFRLGCFFFFGWLVLEEEPLLKFLSIGLTVSFKFGLEVVFHFFLSLVIECFDFLDFVHIEDVIVANLIQKLQQKRSLSLGPSLGHSLVEVGVQVGLLNDLVNDVSVSNVEVLAVGQFSILDPLLAEGELEHLDSLQ